MLNLFYIFICLCKKNYVNLQNKNKTLFLNLAESKNEEYTFDLYWRYHRYGKRR